MRQSPIREADCLNSTGPTVSAEASIKFRVARFDAS